MNEESRWNVDSWNAPRGLPWDVTERGADTAVVMQAARPQVVQLLLAPRRRYVTRADLRRMARQSSVQHVLKLLFMGRQQHLTRKSVGQRLASNWSTTLKVHELFQVHKRRRDVEPEVEVDRTPGVREDEGDPAPLGQQDVEMPVETIGEFASVKRGAEAVLDNEEGGRLRPRAKGKRGQKHDVQDVLEPQAKTKTKV